MLICIKLSKIEFIISHLKFILTEVIRRVFNVNKSHAVNSVDRLDI